MQVEVGRFILEHLRPEELKEFQKMAKRDGYVIEEIIERSNLEEAFDTVLRGTLRKSLSEGRWLLGRRSLMRLQPK